MNQRTAVVLGASGLIGSQLVTGLLKDDTFIIVRLLVRRTLPIVNPKLQQEIVDFENIDDFNKKLGEGDIIFSCIGTTQQNVKGNREAYEKIDYDIPVNAARMGVSKNYKTFLMVSSVGADENASNFYLRLKGKTENAIRQFPFQSISFFRPSMLLGDRKEKRRGEKILQGVMKAVSQLFFGSFKKYRAIQAYDVAKAMIKQSKQNEPGIHFPEFKEIMKLAEN